MPQGDIEAAKKECGAIKDFTLRRECFERKLCPGGSCTFRAGFYAWIYGPPPQPGFPNPEDILTKDDVILIQNLYRTPQDQVDIIDTASLLPLIQRLQDNGFHRAAIAGAELLVDIEVQKKQQLPSHVVSALDIKADALDSIGKRSAALSTRSLAKLIR